MKNKAILLIAAVMVTATGCDFMRVLAGRPTSRDIENKRVEILKAEEALVQARLDSIRRAEEKVVTDSLAAMDTLAAYAVQLTGQDRIGGLVSADLPFRYYIIVGAFKERANAQKLSDKAVAAGYQASLLDCRRGMVAVGLCPCNKVADVSAALLDLMKEPFCPKDAWVLVNE